MWLVPVAAKRHQSRSACAAAPARGRSAGAAVPPPLRHEPLERGDGRVGRDAARRHHRQRHARVLVDDVEQLQHPAVCGLVAPAPRWAVRPAVARRRSWSHPAAGACGDAEAPAAPPRATAAGCACDSRPTPARAVSPTPAGSPSGGGRARTRAACSDCRRAAILSVQESSDFVSPAVSVGGCRGAGLASRHAVGPDVAADGVAGDPEQPGGRPHRESL